MKTIGLTLRFREDEIEEILSGKTTLNLSFEKIKEKTFLSKEKIKMLRNEAVRKVREEMQRGTL